MMGFGYRTQADKRILYEIKLLERQKYTRYKTIEHLEARISLLKEKLNSHAPKEQDTKESLKKAGE
jgi:hypothetical protein